MGVVSGGGRIGKKRQVRRSRIALSYSSGVELKSNTWNRVAEELALGEGGQLARNKQVQKTEKRRERNFGEETVSTPGSPCIHHLRGVKVPSREKSPMQRRGKKSRKKSFCLGPRPETAETRTDGITASRKAESLCGPIKAPGIIKNKKHTFYAPSLIYYN